VQQRLGTDIRFDRPVRRKGRRALGHVDAAAVVADGHQTAYHADPQAVVDVGGVLGAADADGARLRLQLVVVVAGFADAAADRTQPAAQQAHEAALIVARRPGQAVVVQPQRRALAQRHHGAVDHAQLHAALGGLHGLARLDALAGLQLADHALGRDDANVAAGEHGRGRRCAPGQAVDDAQRGHRQRIAKAVGRRWRAAAISTTPARRSLDAAHWKLLWAVIWNTLRE
jgi:hypothetical protein